MAFDGRDWHIAAPDDMTWFQTSDLAVGLGAMATISIKLTCTGPRSLKQLFIDDVQLRPATPADTVNFIDQ
jgi:hypothetical protein